MSDFKDNQVVIQGDHSQHEDPEQEAPSELLMFSGERRKSADKNEDKIGYKVNELEGVMKEIEEQRKTPQKLQVSFGDSQGLKTGNTNHNSPKVELQMNLPGSPYFIVQPNSNSALRFGMNKSGSLVSDDSKYEG